MTALRTSLIALAALLVLMAAAGTAAAHKTAYTPDGKIKIVWGFLNEPAVTMTKTGLDLRLSSNETGAPIAGAEKTLNASLVYGDQVHDFALSASHGTAGAYTDKITLTRPGLYSLRLVGTINGTEVDMTIPGAHEVAAIEETYFPALGQGAGDADARIRALEAKVTALEGKLATQTGTPADVTPQGGANDVPAAGLLPALAVLGVAALVLARRRRA